MFPKQIIMILSDSLCSYIEKEIIPLYVHFDKAHQTDHVRKVIDESLKLARHYQVDINMVYAIAAFHDIGLCEGRERHHIVSGEMLRDNQLLHKWFNEEQIRIMAEAVEDHRASNQHTPRSIYGKIVAEADRLINPYHILLRTLQYGLSHYPELNKEQHYLRFCEHLQEKYAEGGYLKLWIPESDNAIQLAELRRILANPRQLQSMFDTLFSEISTK